MALSKITKTGGSAAIIIPSVFIQEMDLSLGQEIELEINELTKTITVKKIGCKKPCNKEKRDR